MPALFAPPKLKTKSADELRQEEIERQRKNQIIGKEASIETSARVGRSSLVNPGLFIPKGSN